MIESENNLYSYNEKESELKIYSDELEKTLSNINIHTEDIELEKETGDIYCYIQKLNYKKVNCNKLCDYIKDKIPLIQDIFLEDGYFILTFNIKTIELY